MRSGLTSKPRTNVIQTCMEHDEEVNIKNQQIFEPKYMFTRAFFVSNETVARYGCERNMKRKQINIFPFFSSRRTPTTLLSPSLSGSLLPCQAECRSHIIFQK